VFVLVSAHARVQRSGREEAKGIGNGNANVETAPGPPEEKEPPPPSRNCSTVVAMDVFMSCQPPGTWNGGVAEWHRAPGCPANKHRSTACNRHTLQRLKARPARHEMACAHQSRHLVLCHMFCCLPARTSLQETEHMFRGALTSHITPGRISITLAPYVQTKGTSAAHLEGEQRVALGRGRGGAEVAADVGRGRRLAGLPLRHRLQQRPRQLHQLLVLHARPCSQYVEAK
jgi:hypothetical protein